MKTAVKVAIGGAALLGAYLLFGKKNPDGSIGISVTKTSSECDPSSPNYKGGAACTASDLVNGAIDGASSVVDAITGADASSSSEPDFTPTVPPKTTDAIENAKIRVAASRAGGDGPLTGQLQVTKGSGALLDERVPTHISTKLSHR